MTDKTPDFPPSVEDEMADWRRRHPEAVGKTLRDQLRDEPDLAQDYDPVTPLGKGKRLS